ncbi:MAG TPA: hypothetical protein VGM36_16855, partial [Rhizomicrobium sp.]
MQSRSRITMAAIMLASFGWSGVASGEDQSVDILIKGGTIYDGSENPPFTGDIAVRDGKIVFSGPSADGRFRAKRTIDAAGLIVAPGFIDAHTHPDTYIRSGEPSQRTNAPWLMQGVSTVLIGVDGGGTPDVAEEFDHFRQQGIGTNVVAYVGFGAVRERVLGQDDRAPNADELSRMKTLVAKGMCEGADGLSTGLFYAPQSFAKTDEVVALAKEAAVRGGLYDTHQRDESSYTIGVLNSVKETIEIGREANIPVHFAHLKALGVDVQGQAPEIVKLIEDARATGQDVTADQYPWLASSTGLDAALLPRWSVAGGYDELLKRLGDPATLVRIRTEMQDNLRRRGGAQSILLTGTGKPWTGKYLSQIADEWHVDPVEAAIRIFRESRRNSIASFNMAESDVEYIMKQPWVVTSSDGNDGHPRQYATFPEKYAVYVKEKKVIGLENFIRHSTGLTADMLKIDHRG